MNVFLLSCQVNDTKNRTNLLNIDLKKDLKTILKETQLEKGSSDLSEHLNSFKSKDLAKFSLGTIRFNDEIKIDKLEIPYEKHIHFVTKREDEDQICVISIEYSSLKSKTESLQPYIDIFGKPDKLNEQNSINKMKGNDNFIWKNYSNEYTYILSQSSTGSITLKDSDYKKVHKSIFYIIDNNSFITYPNKQKENILEKLVKRLSY